MELIMLLGEQVMDAVPINPIMLQSPDYLTNLQQELRKRNEYMLKLIKEKPLFAIENVP